MTLFELRKSNKYSLEYVSKILGVNRATYTKIERQPALLTVGQAEKLAKLYCCSPADIFLASNYN